MGLALTNPSSTQAQTALVVAYDETGKVIVNDFSIVLQPLQHMAFVLDQQFPSVANQRGKIRVFGIPAGNIQLPFLGLNGMGVRNLPDGSFTNLQVTLRTSVQRSFRISRAALCPGAPMTPPPGCAPEPHRYRPLTGVR